MLGPGGDDHWLAVIDAFGAAALGSEPWTDALSKFAHLTGSRGGQLIGIGPQGPLAELNCIADEDLGWLTDEVFRQKVGVNRQLDLVARINRLR